LKRKLGKEFNEEFKEKGHVGKASKGGRRTNDLVC